EKFSSLVGGQLSADLQQADGIATRNLADRLQNETAKTRRQRECLRSARAIFDPEGQFGYARPVDRFKDLLGLLHFLRLRNERLPGEGDPSRLSHSLRLRD